VWPLPRNDALLLIGHGSARYPNAGAVIHRHAATLRALGHFSQIQVALLNGPPTVDQALAQIDAPTIRVVPFFMEDGYFTRVAIPKAIAAGLGRICLCPPVGVHHAISDIIRDQALTACSDRGVPPDHAAVLIVGHGSAKAPGRALALFRHAACVASTALFARVEAACLEEAPFVADQLYRLRTHPVVVIGFFANQGGHVRDDVPSLIAAEQAARLGLGPDVRFHGSVTDHPTLTRIIVDQAKDRQR
jgi:sirohydrochlorin cobaltochelatase